MESREILVSIIVPIYNSELNLNECINSLINQTLIDIEIILINDGSSDNSSKIIEKFKKLDDRIIVVNKKNQGVSATRNLGIRLSRGKFIGFIDSDDYIDCKMYEKLYHKIIKYNVQLAMCKFSKVGKKGNDNEVWNFYYEDIKPAKFILQNMLGVDNEKDFDNLDGLMGSTCRCIYDKKILDKYNISFNEEITYAEDLLFNINYLCNIEKVALINEVLYYYRNSENSLSKGYRNDLFIMIRKLTYEIEQIIRNNKYKSFEGRLNFTYFKYGIELIRNETKTIKPINYNRYKNISLIVKYKEVSERLKNINIKRLNIKYKFFYLMFKYKIVCFGVLFLLIRIIRILFKRICFE